MPTPGSTSDDMSPEERQLLERLDRQTAAQQLQGATEANTPGGAGALLDAPSLPAGLGSAVGSGDGVDVGVNGGTSAEFFTGGGGGGEAEGGSGVGKRLDTLIGLVADLPARIAEEIRSR